MEKKFSFRRLIPLLLLAGLLVFVFVTLSRSPKGKELKNYSDVISMFKEELVESFSVEENTLTMKLNEKGQDSFEGEKTVYYELRSYEDFREDLNDTIREQLDAGTLTKYDAAPIPDTPWIVSILPYLLIALLLVIFVLWITNRANGNNMGAKFSKANTRFGTGSDKVSFRDVAGAEEEKAELAEIVDFLRNPKKYHQMGAKIPKGVLLVGPPGTGKTLLARAVAGEAGVEFLSISGSDFVELYVGVGASRVRDLFDQAKKLAPAIIFIDEIDAVGRRRGAGLGGGHDEREQTLNQLLVEMDGFAKNQGVIVMAATNRADILDPALLRPGRFDRQIYIGTPDLNGREAILKIHAAGKPLSDTVDLKTVAKATGGFTGADLENLLNEAALLAARNNRPVILMSDLEEAILKVLAGPEKKSHTVSEYDRKLTAFHEAGHAVAMYHLPTQDPVHRITIMPRGRTGGMTVSLPQEESDHWSKKEMFETVVSLLGGRVAEALYLDDITDGASNDLKRATEIVHNMVAKYGMTERIGAVSYDNDSEIFVGRDFEKTKSYSEKTASAIDEEMKRIMDEAYAKCESILKQNDEKLREVASFLIEHTNMSRAQFEQCMKGEEITQTAEGLFESFTEEAKSEETPEMPTASSGDAQEEE